MAHTPDPARYDRMPYRRCGRSGVVLPAVTLGLWQNFGALASAVRQGKATYVGISSYSVTKTREAAALLRQMGVPR